MGHPLRWYVPGVVYEITTRTIQERFLLKPSAEARELIVGVIARGAQLYPSVAIHGFAFLSNHYHLLVSATDGAQLSRFIGYVNGNVAREMGRRYSWHGPFWARRHRSIPIVDDAAAEGRLRYLLAQGVKEGLVDRPEQWPGATSIAWLLDRPLTGKWICRDMERRLRGRSRAPDPATFTTHYELALAPLPSWRHLTRAEIAERVRRMIDEIVAEAGAARRGRTAGVRAVLSLRPHDAPKRSARVPAPACHASTSSCRTAFRAAYRAFTYAFRIASTALRRGVAIERCEFPPGSFPSALTFVDWSAPLVPPWSQPSLTANITGSARGASAVIDASIPAAEIPVVLGGHRVIRTLETRRAVDGAEVIAGTCGEEMAARMANVSSTAIVTAPRRG